MQKISASYFLLSITLLVANAAYSANWPDFAFVAVQGKAEKAIAPDIATLGFTVRLEAETSAEATEKMHSSTNRIMQILREQQFTEEQITAFAVQKSAIRAREAYVELEIIGYVMSRQFEIEVRDIQRFSKLTDSLHKEEYVIDLDAVFDTATRASVETALIKEASEQARHKAKQLAEAQSLSLSNAYAISEENISAMLGKFLPKGSFTAVYEYQAEAMQALGGANSIFVPSTIILTKQVNVIYRLEPPS